MIVSHIALKNWRNFQIVDVKLGNRVFIVGPNASGKSNFVDVFRFLRDIAKPGGGLQKAVSERGGLSKIRCLAARQNPDVEIEATLSDPTNSTIWKYSISIKQEVRGYRHPYLAYERVWHNNSVVISRPDDKDEKDSPRLTQTYLEQIGSNESFRDIAKFFESTMYQHLVPQLLRHPQAFSGTGIPDDPFGQNFMERVAQTREKTRRARLKQIAQALRIAVPQLKHLTDIKDEIGVPHLETVYEHWRPKGAKQREDQFSDGTLRLIGLLWSLLEGDSLLLLEEPELSLNSGIIRRLPGLIYRLQRTRKRQVILTTHSADLLTDKGIGGEEVLLLIPGNEGTDISSASSKKEIKAMLDAGMSVGEAALPRTVPPLIEQLSFFNVTNSN